MEQESYLSLAKPSLTEIEIKKSRFIAMCTPSASKEEALDFIEQARIKYPDATHHCYAYSVGYPKVITHQDDDGEPHQTAGRPILRVLEANNLVNAVIVVVRYFGGILLGAGGLVRAYTNASRAGVETSGIVEYILSQKVRFDCDYSTFGKVEYYLKVSKLKYETLEFGERIVLGVQLPAHMVEEHKSQLMELLKADTKWEELQRVYSPTCSR